MYRVHIELVDGIKIEYSLEQLPYNLNLEEITYVLNKDRYKDVRAITIEKGNEDATTAAPTDV